MRGLRGDQADGVEVLRAFSTRSFFGRSWEDVEGTVTLGGGFMFFVYFHPYLGKISNLTNIFQSG